MTLQKHEVNLGSRTFKVLIPIQGVEDLYVIRTDTKGAVILGNECGLEMLENILIAAAQGTV